MENTDVVVNNEVELVSLKLAKKHLKLDADYNEEDELIEVAIASAISQAENYTERKFIKSTLLIKVHKAESFIVERSSLNDTVQKVVVVEEGVDSIPLPSTSFSQTKRGPEHYEVSFKDVELQPGQSLEVSVAVGYDFKTLPKSILSALLLMVGDAFEKREDRNQGSNTAVNNLLRPYRKWL